MSIDAPAGNKFGREITLESLKSAAEEFERDLDAINNSEDIYEIKIITNRAKMWLNNVGITQISSPLANRDDAPQDEIGAAFNRAVNAAIALVSPK